MGNLGETGLATPAARPAVADQTTFERLFAIAVQYRNEGSPWQAMDMCWTLVEDFSGTRQSRDARAMLLDMAAQYEREGARHVATKIYERLSEI